MKVSNWINEDGCAYRYLVGKDPQDVRNRVAFIEKTPRVRIRSAHYIDQGLTCVPAPRYQGEHDWLNWAEGYKGDGPNDPESRKWCDDALKLFGYDYT